MSYDLLSLDLSTRPARVRRDSNYSQLPKSSKSEGINVHRSHECV
jgi:hypothetical protein